MQRIASCVLLVTSVTQMTAIVCQNRLTIDVGVKSVAFNVNLASQKSLSVVMSLPVLTWSRQVRYLSLASIVSCRVSILCSEKNRLIADGTEATKTRVFID